MAAHRICFMAPFGELQCLICARRTGGGPGVAAAAAGTSPGTGLNAAAVWLRVVGLRSVRGSVRDTLWLLASRSAAACRAASEISILFTTAVAPADLTIR